MPGQKREARPRARCRGQPRLSASQAVKTIGVGKARRLPSLRTVLAVLPHTALQSLVSSSGPSRLLAGCGYCEQSETCKVRIWPALMIVGPSPKPGSLLLLAQDPTQPPSDKTLNKL